ncbi:C40 family peptidase [Qipengyuania sp. 6B39]|uniref:NlpC/P60 family protein n=1 Tax=Qipengyuania proteolytica TaxID=2867239 RepID=UPI001C898BF7|nr:NlpC/P60 family protein [Qipengyuania proteolytica]MBX7494453.1 C40 family peptidase [Qipengyuania proteolytica]
MTLADAAETLVGTPFRLHGRSPVHGVDCVGLVACALTLCGREPRPPSGYQLRNCDIAAHLDFAHRNGFEPVAGRTVRGDLLLVTPGPAQHHLLVSLGTSDFIHAHAGLRRVVRTIGTPQWPILNHWRLAPN